MSGVRHAKVSTVPDGPDASLVRPSDWNTDHSIDDGTITAAMLAPGVIMAPEVTDGVVDVSSVDQIEITFTPAAAPTGVVPVGGIVMWSGSIATIPAPTWELCDGTANAPGPDLRDKFVVGARQDSGGVAKTNIEGTLKQSATATGASIADHAGLAHAGGAVSDHTGLSHDGGIADHPALTHAALSHPALTVAHPDHSVASGTHTHASGADVSVQSATIASRSDLSRPAVSHAHASRADLSTPGQTIASGVDVSVPSATAPSGTDHTAPSYAAASGISALNTITRSVVTTGGLLVTVYSGGVGGSVPSVQSKAGVSYPSHSHAAASASRPSLAVASAANASMPSLSDAGQSGADVSMPSLSMASSVASRPSASGSQAAVTLTHADHSLASLSHQAIGTHAAMSHAFTPPASHGASGTLTHAFTQPSAHSISSHSTVAIVPAYFALAFIQRML